MYVDAPNDAIASALMAAHLKIASSTTSDVMVKMLLMSNKTPGVVAGTGLYDTQGNIKQGMTKTESTAYEVWSGVALVPAAPFAIAQSLPLEVWNAIAILLGAAK